jgi:GTPase involved in cell partitioning and DNA repair
MWFNSDWVGRALRRNHFVIDMRRSKGREVMLDFNKILEKAGKFGIEIEKKPQHLVQSKLDVKDDEI